MVFFWILATLMTLAALAFVLVPMLRARPRGAPSAVDANLEVLRAQRREIESDIANGTLPAASREEALAELVGRAEADLVPAPAPAAAERKPWLAAALVAVAVPAIAFGLYRATGNPAAMNTQVALDAKAPMDDQKIVAMVENLALKVKERPDDAQGWALLARSMAALGRFKESAAAYERLSKLQPRDPQVLADYADSLGMAQGRTLVGRPYELIREALRIDPKHKKALALAGTAALDAGDFKGALGYWQALAGELQPGSPDEAQVRSIVAEIREKTGAGRAPAAAPASSSVTGSVALAPAVAAKVSGTETLFIFARAEGGARVPLAVIRASAAALPLKFALDDSQAMAPGMNLSSAQSVRIEARISRSGNASPQPGDLVGASGVVKPGARGVNIVVDRVLP